MCRNRSSNGIKMRLALIVEYEGTKYCGFQYQTNAPSVQGELELAVVRFTGEKSRVKAAGRTDAGVHAKGQVVAFDTDAKQPPGTFVRALNFYLPDDIGVKEAYITADDFDPRRMALSRKYCYTIDVGSTPSPLIRRTVCYLGIGLDLDRMRKAASYFVGEHDFSRFGGHPGGSTASTVRAMYNAKVSQYHNMVRFEIEGKSFLPHQVRRMAGAIVDVGKGNLELPTFESMIENQSGDAVAHALPPNGLCLLQVTYMNFPPKIGGLNDYIS